MMIGDLIIIQNSKSKTQKILSKSFEEERFEMRKPFDEYHIELENCSQNISHLIEILKNETKKPSYS